MALGLLVLSLFAVSLWWYGLRQRRGSAGWLTLAPAALALAAVLTVGVPEAPSAATASGEVAEGDLHETFSTARLAELRAAGTPVFVDFTADWCLVCKVNERVAIDTEATQEAFRSEEHTSELQSLMRISYAVFCLQKKKCIYN